MSPQFSGKKIIDQNAILLYIRMFFTMAIGSYISRVVLKALGVSDSGVFNIVGGVIAVIIVWFIKTVLV